MVVEPQAQHKLPGRGHLQLDGVQEFSVFFQRQAHLGIFLLANSLFHEVLVVIEALGGVGANHLQLGQGIQHHEQALDFDFDIGVGQHRDVRGLDGEVYQLPAGGFQAVGGKSLEPQQVLHRLFPAFFLFLLVQNGSFQCSAQRYSCWVEMVNLAANRM